MRSTRGLITVALLALLATSARAAVTPIDSLNYDGPTGLPLYNGLVLTIQGTVTSPDSIFQTASTDVHIQDGTGATDVFLSGGMALYHFAFGDSVQVTGQVTTFSGLTEISLAVGGSVTHLGPANVIPVPAIRTCSQANVAYVTATNYEPDQSKLLRINGVHLTAGSWPTTVSTTNVQLQITDASGAVTLFIDKDSPLNGSPNPGALFDIEGVLRQFKSASPFTSGYEIVPRFLSDVIPQCPGPGFSQNPAVVAVDSLSATIAWTTSVASSSVLNWGATTSYGNSATDGLVGTSHQVTLTGLTPRTLYHVQAQATNVNGTCSSIDRSVITFPSPGTPGDISVYFNQSVDNTVARPGVPLAQGNVACDQKLVELINTAKLSVDCALYSFSLQNVTNALISAKLRGCTVRLIQDAGNSTSQATQLQSNGVNYITSTYAGSHSVAYGGGIMHSKYVIIDANYAVKDSAKIWTGAWNCSISGQGDAQDVVVLRDWGLAQAYTMDFEQMWGGTGPAPNPVTSRMGSRKSEVIPHMFLVGGLRVDAFMSPSDRTETNLVHFIQQAQHTQYFAMLDFTSDPLSHAMKLHRDSLGDAVFKVRGLFEPSSVNASSEWCKLDGQAACTDFWTPRADVFQDPSTQFNLLHHKYTILDEGYPEALLWAGSHNWSNAANTVNDENSVAIHDPAIANIFYQEWYKRYIESGGAPLAGVGPGGATVAALELAQSRPNPSHGPSEIKFTLASDALHVSLGVFDLSGRLVRSLASGALSAGEHTVRWDGTSTDGRLVPAGLYFYRLNTGNGSVTRKLVLAK